MPPYMEVGEDRDGIVGLKIEGGTVAHGPGLSIQATNRVLPPQTLHGGSNLESKLVTVGPVPVPGSSVSFRFKGSGRLWCHL